MPPARSRAPSHCRAGQSNDTLIGVGAGVSYYFGENKLDYLDYQGEFNNDRKNNTITAGLRVMF